tara:strand:- start:22 stop:552 length:531 start_codon:yes stop_codon:yes gene_type:complete
MKFKFVNYNLNNYYNKLMSKYYLNKTWHDFLCKTIEKQNMNNILNILKKRVKPNSNLEFSLILGLIHKIIDKSGYNCLITQILKHDKYRDLFLEAYGRNKYTPAFRAGWKGNYNNLHDIFCIIGLDKSIINGETIYDAINSGREYNLKKNPDYYIIINDQYDECILIADKFNIKKN